MVPPSPQLFLEILQEIFISGEIANGSKVAVAAAEKYVVIYHLYFSTHLS